MLFNYKTDTVLGKVTYFFEESVNGEVTVIGIYKDNSEFIKLSQEEAEENFPHLGKVFITDTTKLKDKGIESGNYIEFSTQAIQVHQNVEFDDYAMDLYTPFYKVSPNLLFLNALKKDNSDSKYYINLENISSKGWSGYIYDDVNKILYDKIKNNSATGVEADKGTFINGIDFDLYQSPDFIFEENRCVYTSKYFAPYFSEDKTIDTIDLSNRSQKIDWLKGKIKELNKFSERDLQYINQLLNQIKVTEYFEVSSLVKNRINTISTILDKIIFSNNEIKILLNKNSSIGSYLIKQLIDEKDKYCKDLFDGIEKEASKKKELINSELEDLKLTNKQLSSQNDKLNNSILVLDQQKKILDSDISVLENNKKLIYVTIKAIIENNSSLSPVTIKEENSNLVTDDFNYDIYKVNSNLEMVDDENFEECLYQYTKIDTLVYILKNKFSFIPSISWTYSLAKYLGNSEVLNMSVEYDWLHYSDFVNHGLLKFIEDCKNSPQKFFFLHFDNLNIIPLDCGFSSIYKVFTKEKPFFNGTSLELPDNLFVTATLIATKNDKTTGNSIPENYRKLFSGIGTPDNDINVKLDKVESEYKYSYNKELKLLINELQTNNNKEYYEY